MRLAEQCYAEVQEEAPRELNIAIDARGEAQGKARPGLLRSDALDGGAARMGLLQVGALGRQELRDPVRVREPRRAFLAGPDEKLACQLAHGLEQLKARLAVLLEAHEQALFHKRRQAVERIDPRIGHDGGSRGFGEAAGEDAKATEEDALLRTQQIETPLEGGAQGLVPLRHITLAADKERKWLVQSGQHGLRREHAHARGSEFDGQR